MKKNEQGKSPHALNFPRGHLCSRRNLSTNYEAGFLGHSHLYKPTILLLALAILPQLWNRHQFFLAFWKQVAILTLLPAPTF